jgi:hypothetical protein
MKPVRLEEPAVASMQQRLVELADEVQGWEAKLVHETHLQSDESQRYSI